MRTIILLSMGLAYLVWKLAADPQFWPGYGQVGYSLDGSGGNDIDLVLLFAGQGAVFLFYWFKFGHWAGEGEGPKGFSPRPARHFTTWLRFIAWGGGYSLLMLLAFNVLVFFPDIVPRIVDAFAQASADLKAPVAGLAEAQSLTGLLNQDAGDARFFDHNDTNTLIPYAVILVTVVWAELRPFSQFERHFRQRVQQRAAIPAGAQQLMSDLDSHNLKFQPDARMQSALIEAADGTLSADDFAGRPPQGGARWLHARNEYLFERLQQYRFKPLLVGLSERYRDEYDALESRMQQSRKQLQERLRDIREELADQLNESAENEDIKRRRRSAFAELNLADAESELAQLSKDSFNRLRERHFKIQNQDIEKTVKGTWDDMRMLVVCTVLAAGRTQDHREKMLDDFGLKLPFATKKPLPLTTLILLAAGLVVVVFAGSWLYDQLLNRGAPMPPHAPEGLRELVWWSVAATLMHLVGALGGYAAQRAFEFRREYLALGDSRSVSPSEAIAEVIMAATFAVTLNIGLLAALLAADGDFPRLSEDWWWALVPGVTGGFAAYYAQVASRRCLAAFDNSTDDEKRATWSLWLQGPVTGATAVVVVALLNPQVFTEASWNMALYAGYVAVTAAAVGFMCGWVLFTWSQNRADQGVAQAACCRRARENQPERRANRQPCHVKAHWQAADQTVDVEVFSQSDKGVALRSKARLKVPQIGHIVLRHHRPRKAKVTRQDEYDPSRFYLQYLDEAA